MDRTYIAQVEKRVRIIVKPGQGLTKDSVEEFNRLIYYAGETVEEHYVNLAKMVAEDRTGTDFVEGYGNMKELGIEIDLDIRDSEIEQAINN